MQDGTLPALPRPVLCYRHHHNLISAMHDAINRAPYPPSKVRTTLLDRKVIQFTEHHDAQMHTCRHTCSKGANRRFPAVVVAPLAAACDSFSFRCLLLPFARLGQAYVALKTNPATSSCDFRTPHQHTTLQKLSYSTVSQPSPTDLACRIAQLSPSASDPLLQEKEKVDRLGQKWLAEIHKAESMWRLQTISGARTVGCELMSFIE